MIIIMVLVLVLYLWGDDDYDNDDDNHHVRLSKVLTVPLRGGDRFSRLQYESDTDRVVNALLWLQ